MEYRVVLWCFGCFGFRVFLCGGSGWRLVFESVLELELTD